MIVWSTQALLSLPPHTDRRQLLSERSSRKSSIHTRAISLISAVAWQHGPRAAGLASIRAHFYRNISLSSLFSFYHKERRSERSHPNKSHPSVWTARAFICQHKGERGHVSISTARRAGRELWVSGSNGSTHLVERWGCDDSWSLFQYAPLSTWLQTRTALLQYSD